MRVTWVFRGLQVSENKGAKLTDHGSQYTIGAPNLPRDKGGAKPENGQNRQKAGSMLRRATRRNVRIDAGNDALDPRSRLDTEWRPA